MNTNVSRAQNVRTNWGWLLALGILFIILGCVGFSMVIGLTIVSMLFFGVLLVIGGFLQIIDLFKAKHWRGAVWHALISLLYLVAGAAVIYNPLLASTIFTAILAWVFIIMGLTRFAMAFSLYKSPGWGWVLLAGFTNLILGVLILAQWPWSGLWIIGLFIAIELMMSGWTYVFMFFAHKKV